MQLFSDETDTFQQFVLWSLVLYFTTIAFYLCAVRIPFNFSMLAFILSLCNVVFLIFETGHTNILRGR